MHTVGPTVIQQGRDVLQASEVTWCQYIINIPNKNKKKTELWLKSNMCLKVLPVIIRANS